MRSHSVTCHLAFPPLSQPIEFTKNPWLTDKLYLYTNTMAVVAVVLINAGLPNDCRMQPQDFIIDLTHTHTTVLLLVWNMSGSTRVRRYQKGKTKKV